MSRIATGSAAIAWVNESAGPKKASQAQREKILTSIIAAHSTILLPIVPASELFRREPAVAIIRRNISGGPSMPVNSDQLELYVASCRSRFEDLLGQMVEIPSISMDPGKASDMRR